MDEKNYLIDLFNKNFSKYKGKRIVLYGISKSTKIILENCKGYNFVGLLDGYQTDGNIYGKNIISIDEISKLKVDAIIIVARISSAKIIYRRINSFCLKNNINLYDMNGTNFENESKFIIDNNEYFNVSEIHLKDEIDSHQIISFDIFDTLIMRKVLYPSDIFELVQQNISRNIKYKFDFVKNRVLAEKQLLENGNPTYDMIYDKLQSNMGISNEEKNFLKNLEFEIEKKYIVQRKKTVEIFQYAISKGKEVYLVSDMYFEKIRLEEILINNDIKGYTELIVSCEHGTSKTEKLFEKLNEYIENKSCLHIGDNTEADFHSARKNNIDAFEIFSAVEMLEISSYKEILNMAESLNQRCMIGLFIERAFNNPFSLNKTKGVLNVNDVYLFGYLFIAPLISEFMKWLVNEIKNNEFSDILFLARDGFIIEQLYQKVIEKFSLNDVPKSTYFLTSRIMCTASAIYGETDILEVSKIAFNGSPELLLKNRFLLDDGDIKLKEDKEQSLEEYILEHKNKIIEKAKKLRETYKLYTDQKDIDFTKKIAVFDFYAAGTCQLSLERIFDSKLYGFYFVRIDDIDKRKKMLDIKSLFKPSTSFNNETFISQGYVFLESIITSENPSLRQIVNDGEVEYLKEKRSVSQLEELNMIHQSINDYFEDYMQFMWEFESNIVIADKILSFILKKYTKIENISIIKDELEDEFFNRTFSFADLLN